MKLLCMKPNTFITPHIVGLLNQITLNKPTSRLFFMVSKVTIFLKCPAGFAFDCPQLLSANFNKT